VHGVPDRQATGIEAVTPTQEIRMTKNTTWMLAATIAAFGAQVAMAQTAPAKSREQVRQECVEARKAGKMGDGDCAPDPAPGKSASPLAREQVRKDCIEARKAGKIEDGECKPDQPTAQTGPTTPRAPVKQQAAEARKAGTTADGERRP
jgi:hypothetical protein